MSTSLYRWTEECDRRECLGDCDLCHENGEDEDDLQTRMPQLQMVRAEIYEQRGLHQRAERKNER